MLPSVETTTNSRNDDEASQRRDPMLLDYVPVHRALHVIDIENLVGGPDTDLATAFDCLENYTALSGYRGSDHVIVGVNPALAVESSWYWHGAQLVTRKGPDGADLALLDAIQNVSWNALRYRRLLIGSGDGIFCSVAADYAAAGLEVGVVSRHSTISKRLRTAAHWVREY